MAYLSSDSPRGRLFLGLVRDGRSLKWAARSAGVHPWIGYRWLGERYCQLRADGVDPDAALELLGCRSTKSAQWEQRHLRRVGVVPRHHLRVQADSEVAFWSAFEAGATVGAAAAGAGVSRATGYRVWQRRFVERRDAGEALAGVSAALRVPLALAAQWDAARLRRQVQHRRAIDADQRRAVRASAMQDEAVPKRGRKGHAKPLKERYWALIREGMTNTEACRVLGVTRRTGTRIRTDRRCQTAAPSRTSTPAGRYLSLRERLQIADLRLMGLSLRAIATELGRSPSTIKRELDRHRDDDGRYLPHRAQDRAVMQRRRPRESKLAVDDRLRRTVQRKLNRYWSPQQISGWLHTLPAGRSGRSTVCTETIYRALILPGAGSLHERYCTKLRTGRKIRRSRWLTGPGATATVKNKTMIDQRPAEVEERVEVGHWEGDLILGDGCRSAMVTLRERVTQFGIVVNLPADHTAVSVNAAVTAAFAQLPAHVTRTLTWDQGVEMARHCELSTATGMPIYFAERSSPWQRGANENFNGLVRQYYPKGTDLSIHSPEHVAATMLSLNTRPRKGLGYKTPARCLNAAIRAVPIRTPLQSESPAI